MFYICEMGETQNFELFWGNYARVFVFLTKRLKTTRKFNNKYLDETECEVASAKRRRTCVGRRDVYSTIIIHTVKGIERLFPLYTIRHALYLILLTNIVSDETHKKKQQNSYKDNKNGKLQNEH